MSYEVEQKFRVASFRVVTERLRKLGVMLGEAVEQVDIYFAHPSRDFATTDEAFRMRRVGNANFLTYKGPKVDATTKTRREIETELAPGRRSHQHCQAMLKALGFRRVAEVRKTRRVGNCMVEGATFEIALDEVSEVGIFVEIETQASARQLPTASSRLANLAKELGLTQSERTSYLELLLRSRQRQK